MLTSNISRFTCIRYFQFMTKNYFNEENDQAQQFFWNSIGGSRNAATFKMERFVVITNGLTIITKRSILDVATVLHPPLNLVLGRLFASFSRKFAKYLHMETCEKFSSIICSLCLKNPYLFGYFVQKVSHLTLS